MATEQDRVAEEYKATLSELTSISKVEINALTMLADDNKEFAVQIASCIETTLKNAPKNRKLPILYLIDSICKNHPQSIYVQLFTQNIVSNFCNVFQVSDESVRKSLHKLRMTWDTTKIFPQKKLHAIDKRVHQMDPNWPIADSLKTTPEPIEAPAEKKRRTQAARPNRVARSRQQMQNNQNANKNQNNNNNNRQAQPQPHQVAVQQSLQQQQQQLQQMPPMLVNQQMQEPIMNQLAPDLMLQPPPPQPFIMPDQQMVQQIAPMMVTQPAQDPQTLNHILPDPQILQHPPQQQQQHQQQPQHQQHQPNHQMMQQEQPFQQQYMQLLDTLYGGKQCSNCSLRFDDNNRYAVHLDWHFRQNYKSENRLTRRKWYYPLSLWVQFREINDDDIQNDANVDCVQNAESVSNLVTDPNEVPTAPASKDDDKNMCSVCNETFEKFWAEEEEEWRLRNATLHEDERVYHPLCLIDMLQTK